MIEHALNMTEAARRLGTSRVTVRRLVREGVLPTLPHPVDRRQRLIPEASIQSLERTAHTRPSHFRSDGAGENPTVRSDEVDAFLDAYWRPK